MPHVLNHDSVGRLSLDPRPFLPGTLILDYAALLRRQENFTADADEVENSFTAAAEEDKTDVDGNGETVHSPSVFDLDDATFLLLTDRLRGAARAASSAAGAPRSALILEEVVAEARLIPLLGYSSTWQETWASDTTFEEVYSGVVTSKEGPRMRDEELDKMRRMIVGEERDEGIVVREDNDDDVDDTLFSRLLRREIPQWRLWESTTHLAFLTPFPNTPGFSVLIPKRRRNSDIFSLDPPYFHALFMALKEFVGFLKSRMGVAAVVVIAEGTGVDYAHLKVAPLHAGDVEKSCTALRKLRKIRASLMSTGKPDATADNPVYAGYVSTEPGRSLSETEMTSLFDRLNDHLKNDS